MRSISILVGLSALGLVAAVPSKHRGHAHLHNAAAKRDEGPVIVTEYKYVTEMIASVTVYVDENGKILYTTGAPTKTPSAPSSVVAALSTSDTTKKTTPAATTPSTTPATSSSAAAPPSSTTPSSTSSEAPPPPPSSSAAPAPAPSPSETSAPAPAPAPPVSNSGDPTSFKGVAYSPYKGTFGQNVNCKSADDVKNDFNKIDASRWDVVRIYGTDCNQVANVLAAAKPKGIRLYLGIYDVNNWSSEIDTIAAAVGGDWSAVHTISVGNESVHKGMSMDAVLAALKAARSKLRGLGYNGWVVAVDTFMVAKADPRLCQESDYAAVNMHPYWDQNTSSDQAGSFMQGQIELLKSDQLCGSSKALVISETGWPSSGATKGKAVCSPEDQSKAISSISGALGKGYVLLSAFDDWWKNPGPDGVEQMFGLMGTAPSG